MMRRKTSFSKEIQDPLDRHQQPLCVVMVLRQGFPDWMCHHEDGWHHLAFLDLVDIDGSQLCYPITSHMNNVH
ncbi:hypothetical protein CapIbe_007947 [Capra ibex]